MRLFNMQHELSEREEWWRVTSDKTAHTEIPKSAIAMLRTQRPVGTKTCSEGWPATEIGVGGGGDVGVGPGPKYAELAGVPTALA